MKAVIYVILINLDVYAVSEDCFSLMQFPISRQAVIETKSYSHVAISFVLPSSAWILWLDQIVRSHIQTSRIDNKGDFLKLKQPTGGLLQTHIANHDEHKSLDGSTDKRLQQWGFSSDGTSTLMSYTVIRI